MTGELPEMDPTARKAQLAKEHEQWREDADRFARVGIKHPRLSPYFHEALAHTASHTNFAVSEVLPVDTGTSVPAVEDLPQNVETHPTD